MMKDGKIRPGRKPARKPGSGFKGEAMPNEASTAPSADRKKSKPGKTASPI